MPRYFFDIHDGKDLRDDDGVVLPSPAEARREAICAAGSILRYEAGAWTGEQWKMQVRDESGGVVTTLTFSAS